VNSHTDSVNIPFDDYKKNHRRTNKRTNSGAADDRTQLSSDLLSHFLFFPSDAVSDTTANVPVAVLQVTVLRRCHLASEFSG
jgi:hypothetical protein